MDVAVPPEGSVTLLGLRETVGQTKTRPDEEIEALRLAVPESPLRLVRVIPEEPDDPQTMVPVVRRAENIHLLVAGASVMPFSAVLGGWGYMGGFAVTKPVS